jgi:[acyl-carrier-protein] S-malonyltransferase
MKIAFVFPGQGSQTVGMGQDFYDAYAPVRELFDMAVETTRLDLTTLCFKGPIQDLTATVNLQPALTTVCLALLAVLENEGIKPQLAAGHSLGEYSALTAAGVLTPADAIRLVHRRGVLMHREATRTEGAMVAVIGMTIDALTPIVEEQQQTGVVAVANHNTETQIVVTGAPQPVRQVADLVKAEGARAIPLKVSGAWHSPLIKGAEPDFQSYLSEVTFKTPRFPVIHNVNAAAIAEPEAIRGAMASQLCSPVRWYDTMLVCSGEYGVDTYIEIGPGKVLTGMLKKTLDRRANYRLLNIKDRKSLEKTLEALA